MLPRCRCAYVNRSSERDEAAALEVAIKQLEWGTRRA